LKQSSAEVEICGAKIKAWRRYFHQQQTSHDAMKQLKHIIDFRDSIKKLAVFFRFS
jgi:hypothetical protein